MPHPAKRPEPLSLAGRYCALVPLDAAAHASALWEATRAPENAELWRYLFDGPFTKQEDFQARLAHKAAAPDALYFAILDSESRRAAGYCSLMRIVPEHACIEVGDILYTPRLQHTRAATEAMYLLAHHVFEQLGYRRYEWKCHARNQPSRRAALRLGFQFEGIFRQHMIVKGHNRDTAWFSMLDCEWPDQKHAFESWLHPQNFDANGIQLAPLARPAASAGMRSETGGSVRKSPDGSD